MNYPGLGKEGRQAGRERGRKEGGIKPRKNECIHFFQLHAELSHTFVQELFV